MCEHPWSNRDLFQYVNDCHIYVPIFTFLVTANIIFAFVAFIFSVSEFFKRSRRNIPIVCMLNEFLFILSWVSCLGTNQTFASGNYLINAIYGISKGGFYLTINLFTLRNVEVLLIMDKIKPEHNHTLRIVQFIMTRVIVFLSIPIQSLALTLPIRFPEHLSMTDTILYVQWSLGVFTSPFSWFYVYTLRKNVSQLKTSRSVYDPVEKKLSLLLKVGISQWTVGIGLTFCLLYIPLLHQNMYIPFCIVSLLSHVSTFRYLHATSADGSEDDCSEEGVTMVSHFAARASDATLDGSDRFNPIPAIATTPSHIAMEPVDSRLSNQSPSFASDVPEKLEIKNENAEEGISPANTLEERNYQFDV